MYLNYTYICFHIYIKADKGRYEKTNQFYEIDSFLSLDVCYTFWQRWSGELTC